MSQQRIFENRYDAGRQLAESLNRYKGRDDVLVLGLPRGGVPVAYEVAEHLEAPLDIFTVRKLGVPSHEEMAMGAIATGNVRVLNEYVVDTLKIEPRSIDAVEEVERRELQRREVLYRGEHAPPRMQGKIAILVDDGLATGATMRAAVQALEQHEPAEIVVAVPTASRQTCDDFRRMDAVADVICVVTPLDFRAVGLWYRDFGQTTDDEVRRLLDQSRAREGVPSPQAVITS
jgi:predicted phosphoribosyltransferase